MQSIDSSRLEIGVNREERRMAQPQIPKKILGGPSFRAVCERMGPLCAGSSLENREQTGRFPIPPSCDPFSVLHHAPPLRTATLPSRPLLSSFPSRITDTGYPPFFSIDNQTILLYSTQYGGRKGVSLNLAPSVYPEPRLRRVQARNPHRS